MNKIEIFIKEIDLIRDETLKGFIKICVNESPDYFFTMPASTTGKYHPAYTLGDGGLVRHTKAAVKIANDLLRLEQNNHLEADLIISALILHDCIKKGNNGSSYTVTEHPLYASEFIKTQYEELGFSENDLTDKISNIRRLIESHMGQWNYESRSGREVLPKPQHEDEKFVHLCDYLASRRYLTCEI